MILIIYMTGQPLITCFNAQKFHLITFSSKEYSCLSNVYINPELNIINPSSEVLDLGVYMSSNCTFDFHVACVYKRCTNLSGWILRTFSTRETRTMMTPSNGGPIYRFWGMPAMRTRWMAGAAAHKSG